MQDQLDFREIKWTYCYLQAPLLIRQSV
jgi:hypothetical protein